MAFKDPAKAKEYARIYYLKNRERLTKYNKEHHRIKYDSSVDYKERRRRTHIAFIERNPKRRLLSSSKATARNKGYEYNITEDDLNIPTLCPYLGVVLTNEQNSFKVQTNISIDRIDSTQGYIKGNVQVISYLANKMKQDATEEQLISFALGILNVHKQKITSDQFDYLNVLITHAELNQPLQQVTLPVQGDLFKDQQS